MKEAHRVWIYRSARIITDLLFSLGFFFFIIAGERVFFAALACSGEISFCDSGEVLETLLSIYI